MLIIYLACLIFGGILLGFSLFLGGDSDHSAEVHSELELAGADAHGLIDSGHDITVHQDPGESHAKSDGSERKA